jgi:hypothetical protein
MNLNQFQAGLPAKIILLAIWALSAFSCNKERPQNKICTLTINVNTALSTRATGLGLDTTPNMLATKILHIMIYDSKSGALIKYKKLDNPDSVKNIQLAFNAGVRDIYVLGNPQPSMDLSNLTNVSAIRNMISDLKEEDTPLFSYGGVNENREVYDNAVMNIIPFRLVSKLIIRSIRADFAGTPWAGAQLTSPRIYMTNVVRNQKTFFIEEKIPKVYLNKDSLSLTDGNGTRIKNLLCDTIPVSIGSTPYTTRHHFIMYANYFDQYENEPVINPTCVVIEGYLGGIKTYYMIPVNFPTSSSSWTDELLGVMTNKIYYLDITLKGMGSDSPSRSPVSDSSTINIYSIKFQEHDLGNAEI